MQPKGSQFLNLGQILATETVGNIVQDKSQIGASIRRQKGRAPDTPTKGSDVGMTETPGGGFIDGDTYWPPLKTYDSMIEAGREGTMSLDVTSSGGTSRNPGESVDEYHQRTKQYKYRDT